MNNLPYEELCSRISVLKEITSSLVESLEPIPEGLTYFDYESDDLQNYTFEFIYENSRLAIIFDVEPPSAFYYRISKGKGGVDCGPANPQIVKEQIRKMLEL